MKVQALLERENTLEGRKPQESRGSVSA